MSDRQVIQPSKGLYYPNLDFKSAAWVKSALLYQASLGNFSGYGATLVIALRNALTAAGLSLFPSVDVLTALSAAAPSWQAQLTDLQESPGSAALPEKGDLPVPWEQLSLP